MMPEKVEMLAGALKLDGKDTEVMEIERYAFLASTSPKHAAVMLRHFS